MPASSQPRRTLITLLIAVNLLAGLSPAQSQDPDLTRITALIQRGKLQEAEQGLLGGLSKEPNSTRARAMLGEVYLKETRYADAEKVLVRLLAEQPDSGLFHRRLGDAYRGEGKIEPAKGVYLAAVKLDPSDLEAWFALASLYLESGDYPASLAAAEKIPVSKRPPQLLPVLAGDYFGLQEPEKAAAQVRALLQVAHSNPDLMPQLAELLLEHGAVRNAAEVLEAAWAKQEHTDRFLLDLGRTQLRLGKPELAQRSVGVVLERSPQSVEGLALSGQILEAKSAWAQSARYLQRAQKLAPERADLLEELISSLLYGGQPLEALEFAVRLEKLQPDGPKTSYWMALALFGLDRWAEAKPYALKYLGLDPENREIHLAMAGICFDLHDLVEARKHVALCLDRNQNDPGALYYLGLIEKTEGDLQGAIQTLKKSVLGNPQSSDAQSALGALCLEVADLDCARGSLERAVSLSPDSSQNHYQLALAYSRLGRPGEAQVQLLLYRKSKVREQALPAAARAAPNPSRPAP